MKLIAAVLVTAAFATVAPPVSQAQVRVQVNIGAGRHHPYGFSRQYYPRAYPTRIWRGRSCYSYSRYGCYPREVVIVRRPHPGRGLAVRPYYRPPRPRHYRGYR